ncbi:hypothetical protein BC834DRAFT_168137 [Gloeopeniophorella convolvens]|nr:hypothetical protein BC834DRAFT_168137 [Gloeopeniophorella convolvens]
MHSNAGSAPGAAGENREKMQGPSMDSLPDDVLLDIFEAYRLECPVLGRSQEDGPWDWRLLTLVCRRWRQLIFACSTRLRLQHFISNNTRNSDAAVDDILHCSPLLPLTVEYIDAHQAHADSSAGTPPDIKEESIRHTLFALQHAERLLNVAAITDPGTLSTLLEVLNKPVPRLETLHLESFQTSPEGTTLPTAFLSGSAPMLRRLYLRGISPPPMLSSPNLVELNIDSLPIIDASRFSLGKFVEHLGTMPRLESLGFWPCFVDLFPPGVSRSDSPRVQLTSLRSLQFCGDGINLEALLGLLDAPFLSTLNVLLCNEFIVPSLPRFLQNTKIRSGVANIMVHHGRLGVVICSPPPASAYVSFTLIHPFGTALPESFSAICSGMSSILEPTKMLAIGVKDNDPAPDWMKSADGPTLCSALFAPFRKIRSLRVEEQLVHYVARALEVSSTEEMLPHLTDICLLLRASTDLDPSDYLNSMWPFVTSRALSTPRPSLVHKVFTTVEWDLNKRHFYMLFEKEIRRLAASSAGRPSRAVQTPLSHNSATASLAPTSG